jgi:disulfide bond formation protein DsbB
MLSAASPRFLLGSALFLALAAIGGAWFSELALGMVPCKLCLWQRWPYYIAIPVIVLALGIMRHDSPIQWPRLLSILIGVIFILSFGLAFYHAGVEWKFWLGPADCGGRVTRDPASIADFQASLKTARVVLCNEAPMRVLGLSFAGWNGVVSVMIAMLAFRAARNT